MRVLVVARQAETRCVVHRAFAQDRYAITASADVASALAAFRDTPFPLATVERDSVLPDGTPLWRQLRREPGGDHVVILLFAAETCPDDLAELLATGVDDYVALSGDPALLRQRLIVAERQAVSRSQGAGSAPDMPKPSDERGLLRALMEHAPDLVYSKDTASRFVWANRAAARLLGVEDPAELIGKTDFDFFPAELARRYFADEQRVMVTGEPLLNHPEPRTGPPTAERWFVTSTVPRRDEAGRVVGLVGIARDVTETHRAEEQLRAAEAYRTLLEQIPAISYVHAADAPNRLLYVNPRLDAVLGYTPAEWSTPEVPWADHLHPDDRASVLAEVERTAQTGKPFRMEYRERTRDGRYLWFQDEAVLARDPTGAPLCWQGVKLDITARKEAEEAIREREERLRLALGAANMATWDWNLETGDIVRSAEMASLFGCSAEPTDGGLHDYVARSHPDDRELVEQMDRRHLEEGADYDLEYRVVWPDGSVHWLREKAQSIRDATGRPVRMLGVTMDITERKAGEEALRRSEAQLAQAQQIAHVGSWGWDLQSSTVSWSDEMYRIFGLTKVDFDGSYEGFLVRVSSADRPRVAEVIGQALATGGPFSFEHDIIRPDGAVRVLHARGQVTLDETGRPIAMTGTAQDVTEQRQAADALRQNEERFRSLVQNASDIITILDADGTIRYESPAVERVLGYRAGDRVGQNAFHFVHPDDLPPTHAAFLAALKSPALIPTVEFRFRHADGSWRWLEATGTNLLVDPAVGGFVVNSRDVTERKRVETALRESEQRAQRQAQELALLGQVRTALARELELPLLFRTAVEAVAQSFGYTEVSLYLLDGDVLVLQHQVGYDRVIERIPITDGVCGRVVRTGEPVLLEDVRRDPSFLGAIEGICSEVCVPLRDEGRVVGTLNLESRDGVRLGEPDLRTMLALSEHVNVAIGRARLYADARENEARFRGAFDNAPIGMSMVDLDGRFLQVNNALCELVGYTREELLSTDFQAITHPDDLEADLDLVEQTLAGHFRAFQMEKRYFHKDGHVVWVAISVSLLRDEHGRPRYFISQVQDITARRAFEEQLRHQANHDPLTGLPNRALLLANLAAALGRAGRRRRRPGTVPVLFMDLDGFKVVNDSLGHAVGDRLLVAVAQRLATGLRAGDLVARFGGDEFAIVLESVTEADEACRVARRLLTVLDAPFSLDGHDVVVSGSIGIALSSPTLTEPADLLRAADVALYRAKASGRATIALFDPSADEPALARLNREIELRHALERDELQVLYQPVVDLATGVPHGVEALVRWRHPTRGLLQPIDFIPLAEETGLIVPLGRRLLEEACRQARTWQGSAPVPTVRLSVNLSTRQFRSPTLAADLERILRETRLAPDDLTLEITESAAIADATGAIATMQDLRERGVHLAVDDFGTGYAALNSLKRFPVDGLKIDRAFVAGLGRNRDDTAIVGAIVGVAQALGLTVTAEGVETPEQVVMLRELGCDRGQGFYFGRPMAADELEATLLQQPWRGTEVAIWAAAEASIGARA